MEYKIINTGDYLIIVDDSEIKNYYYDFFISKLKHSNGAEYAKSDIAKQVIAHLPLNNLPILEGVDLLPPLEDDVEKLFRDEHEQAVKRAGQEYASGYYEGLHDGYNKAKEKYKYTEEDLRKAFKSGAYMGSYTGNNSGKHIEEAEEKFIKSLQQPKMPVGFKCEMIGDVKTINNCKKFDIETGCILDICLCENLTITKTIINLQGLTQWVGEYIY